MTHKGAILVLVDMATPHLPVVSAKAVPGSPWPLLLVPFLPAIFLTRTYWLSTSHHISMQSCHFWILLFILSVSPEDPGAQSASGPGSSPEPHQIFPGPAQVSLSPCCLYVFTFFLFFLAWKVQTSFWDFALSLSLSLIHVPLHAVVNH